MVHSGALPVGLVGRREKVHVVDKDLTFVRTADSMKMLATSCASVDYPNS